MKKTNILFICRYNRFRSRVAEAYFKKINKNKNIHSKSAGLIKGMPLSKTQITMTSSKQFGIDIKGKPQGLSSKLLFWQDIIIVVADDVPSKVFDKKRKYIKKVIYWKIKDLKLEDNRKEGKRVIQKIIKKVDDFYKKLK